MSETSNFDQAADALTRAMKATGVGEQGLWLDEALRLNRLALAEERSRLLQMAASCDKELDTGLSA